MMYSGYQLELKSWYKNILGCFGIVSINQAVVRRDDKPKLASVKSFREITATLGAFFRKWTMRPFGGAQKWAGLLTLIEFLIIFSSIPSYLQVITPRFNNW